MTTPSTPPSVPATAGRRGRPGYDRGRVLEIAVQLFNEQGYEATSVSDLAVRLGLTKSALYHHFDSREQLLELALDSALSALEAVLDEPGAREGSAAERLRHVIRGAVGVLIDRLPYVTLLLRVRGNSEIELAALERRRLFDHRVTELVGSAQREGLVREDIDAHTATRLIFGMVNSMVEWYRPGRSIDQDRMTHDVLAVALEGIQSRDPIPNHPTAQDAPR